MLFIVCHNEMRCVVFQITMGNRIELVRRANLLPAEAGLIQYIPTSGEFAVQDFNRVLPNGPYYWSLPAQYLGNRVGIVSSTA
jgi:hypothetical protein